MIIEHFSYFFNLGPSLLSALGFVLASFIGEVIAPLPSPLFLIGAAFFIKSPFSFILLYKAIIYAVLPITLGSSIGAQVIFYIAYYGGKPALEHSRKYLRFSWSDVEKFEKRLSQRKYDIFILFISRCIPLLPTTIGNILAGLVRMNPFYYFVVTFVGIFLRILILLFIFHTFGHAIFLRSFDL